MKNLISIVTLFFFLTVNAFAQNKLTEAQQVVERISIQNPQVAISVGVVLQGKEHFFNFGKAARSANAPKVSEQSVYEIASITKAVTGLLLAQAISENKLSANDYIDD